MSVSIKASESVPGPTAAVPFNETSYAANMAFLSWNGRAKGGWVVVAEFNVASVSENDTEVVSIDVPGVAFGDHVELTYNFNPQRVIIVPYIGAADVVTILFVNSDSGQARDLPSGRYVLRITDLT